MGSSTEVLTQQFTVETLFRSAKSTTKPENITWWHLLLSGCVSSEKGTWLVAARLLTYFIPFKSHFYLHCSATIFSESTLCTETGICFTVCQGAVTSDVQYELYIIGFPFRLWSLFYSCTLCKSRRILVSGKPQTNAAKLYGNYDNDIYASVVWMEQIILYNVFGEKPVFQLWIKDHRIRLCDFILQHFY